MDEIYKSVFHRIPVGAILVQRKDPQTFTILDVNPAAAQAEGWKEAKPKDVIGKDINDVFEGLRESGLFDQYNEALDTGRDVDLGSLAYADLEVSFGIFGIRVLPLSKDNLLVLYSNSTAPEQAEQLLRRSPQELEHLVKARTAQLSKTNQRLKREIAERKLAEAELEAKNEELEHFAYTISHDLKSPLFTIKGFLGLLENDIARGRAERVAVNVKQVTNAADKMQLLLNKILELSRIGRLANPSEEVDLVALVGEAVDLVRGNVTARGAAVEIDPALPVVIGDRVRLLQVFQNLLENALKFMGDQDAPMIKIGIRYDDEEAVIYVQDNGIGIDPRYQDKVFRLFERLNPHIEGTGFGLSLVSRIVAVHHGRIWVESKGEGQGSTFCFTLPGEV